MSAPIGRDDWDIEVSTLSSMLVAGMWEAHEIAHIRRQLDERIAQLRSGLGSASQIYWTLKVQKEIDDNCRVRRDPVHGWMLDRWVEQVGCWQPIGYIGFGGRLETTIIRNGVQRFQDGGPGFISVDERDPTITKLNRVIDDVVRPDLITFMHTKDTQREGYWKEKEDKAAAIRLENEKKATEKVLMAVDSLSTDRLKNFIEVEKAIQTGDTVTMHGATMKMFERMTEAGKLAPPGPQSSNPGLHPLRHKRDYSKGEGEAYGNEGS